MTISDNSDKRNLLSQGSNWQKALSRMDGAYADGTLRAYRADIQAYETWCDQKRLRPFPGIPKHIAEFIKHEAERCSAATIKRRLAAIGKIHRVMKINNPVSDEYVSLALRRELRRKTTRPKQALGMTRDIRDKLILACDDTLKGKRDRAIIALGYETLSRRSEIVSVNLGDLSISEKGAKLIIRRSKNDQFGNGRISHISHKTIAFVENWIKSAGINEGPLFRGVKHGRVEACALHPNTISRIVKELAERAGLSSDEVQKLSGHSMRIGAAQDMMSAGLDILPIMAAGGWKTMNVVARYIENADISPLLKKFLHN